MARVINYQLAAVHWSVYVPWNQFKSVAATVASADYSSASMNKPNLRVSKNFVKIIFTVNEEEHWPWLDYSISEWTGETLPAASWN